MQAAAAVVALALGIANLVWLAVQWRRGSETLRIAREAHAWAQERRDAEQRRAQADEAKRAFWRDTHAAVEAASSPIRVPDVDPAWITEGEELGYFRQTPGGPTGVRLWKPKIRST
jgi:hypothetical protein